MEKLYIHKEEIHNTVSAEIIVPLVMDLFPVASVLDVGCGTGTWLKVFHEEGIDDLTGLDGSYIDYNQLMIDRQYFKEVDLRQSFDLHRKFDLVFCLEVAEHLPATIANDLIQSLCRHSDRVVFSSAIPGQGGQNHVNEQWPSYWQEKFLKHGFVRHDLIRPKIWNDSRVDVWYRQNMFLFLREDTSPDTHLALTAEVHPELWNSKIQELARLGQEVREFEEGGAGIKRSFRALYNALRNKILRK